MEGWNSRKLACQEGGEPDHRCERDAQREHQHEERLKRRAVSVDPSISLCLAYLVAALVNSGMIRWAEGGATTVAYLCIIVMCKAYAFKLVDVT